MKNLIEKYWIPSLGAVFVGHILVNYHSKYGVNGYAVSHAFTFTLVAAVVVGIVYAIADTE